MVALAGNLFKRISNFIGGGGKTKVSAKTPIFFSGIALRLSLPRKSVVWINDHPNMTSAVYRAFSKKLNKQPNQTKFSAQFIFGFTGKMVVQLVLFVPMATIQTNQAVPNVLLVNQVTIATSLVPHPVSVVMLATIATDLVPLFVFHV